jgi:hypothetical protein
VMSAVPSGKDTRPPIRRSSPCIPHASRPSPTRKAVDPDDRPARDDGQRASELAPQAGEQGRESLARPRPASAWMQSRRGYRRNREKRAQAGGDLVPPRSDIRRQAFSSPPSWTDDARSGSALRGALLFGAASWPAFAGESFAAAASLPPHRRNRRAADLLSFEPEPRLSDLVRPPGAVNLAIDLGQACAQCSSACRPAARSPPRSGEPVPDLSVPLRRHMLPRSQPARPDQLGSSRHAIRC